MVRAPLMLALGMLVVAEQFLVLRLVTATSLPVAERSASHEKGDPGFIGRAEASTRSVPRPSGVDGLPASPRSVELPRRSSPVAALALPAAPDPTDIPLNRRI
jgi:hypothetical protein